MAEPEKRPKRQPLWVAPPLPTVEIAFYFVFWISHSLGAMYLAYRVTLTNPPDVQGRHMVESKLVPGLRKDGSDEEWDTFISFLRNEYLYCLIAHSLLYQLCKFCPHLPTHKRLMLMVDLAIHVYMFGVVEMLKTMLFTGCIVLITHRTRSIIPFWVICLAFLARLLDFLPLPFDTMVWYKLASILYTYKMAQTISFCHTLVVEGRRTDLWKVFEDFFAYSLYMPYTCMLIVLYSDYRVQYTASLANERRVSYASLMFKAARLIFWAYFIDYFYHFCHVASFYQYTTILERCNWPELISIAYLVGQMFQVKYVVIFGIPSLFAYVDNMTPPLPPICISRVSLYSQVWRRFDRGLYAFLKTHVYIPLVAPSFSIYRRLGALVASYVFVLAWHGTESKFVNWVSMNGVEVALEWSAAALYKREGVKQWIDASIGPLWQRRLLAFTQNVTTALGIFGIFHFLGGEGVGQWKYGPTLRWQFFYILLLGYIYNQCCMEIEKRYDSNAMKWKTE